MSSAGGDKEVVCQHYPCLNMGVGYQALSGSQTWRLALGDSRFGSALPSLLSESNFSLSDLRGDQKNGISVTQGIPIFHILCFHWKSELHR